MTPAEFNDELDEVFSEYESYPVTSKDTLPRFIVSKNGYETSGLDEMRQSIAKIFKRLCHTSVAFYGYKR